MAEKQRQEYGNESITSLKGADRVRLRPGVIFGSDGLEGCQHSFFEILANAIDEARDGFGKVIHVTRHIDNSITVEDEGRGVPVDWNPKEERFNWELVYCELYAGGKYQNNAADGHYEFALGLNGLGACATQYSSEWMNVVVNRDGYRHELHFERGQNVGGLKKTKTDYAHTGTRVTWKPDRDVFTEIDIPMDHYREVLKRQAVANAGLLFELRDEVTGNVETFCYEHGIVDYANELGGEKNITSVQFFEGTAKGRDREDKPEYRVRMQFAFVFNNEVERLEYYHNSKIGRASCRETV